MKPKVDWELLEEHREGVIATTGCLGGQVLQALLQGDFERRPREGGPPAGDLRPRQLLHRAAGPRHPGAAQHEPATARDRPAHPGPDARHERQPLHAPQDAESHDALLCVQTGSLMSDPDRFKFHGEQHFLKSAAEMRSLFSEVPEACDNTLRIAERAEVEIEFGKPQLPNFPLLPRKLPRAK